MPSVRQALEADRATRTREAAVVVAYLSHFRAPFYQALRSAFGAHGVDLKLLYGVTDGHFSRALDWAEPFPVRALPGGATWFPVLSRLARGADVVVVEDASRHLINYALLALRKLGGPKLVLWGHGWNHQTSRPHSWAERIKKQVGRRADGFLAYTDGIRDELIRRGYDARRIHVVRNTIPRPAAPADLHQVARLRARIGLAPDAQVALYCGQIYPLKRVELLIEAAALVKLELPRFELILAGAGPKQSVCERAAATHSFIHFIGPAFDDVKAACFALADVCAIPGVVGLSLVDAFHHGVPPIVTRMPTHGPEIDYLRDEVNGLETRHTAADLAKSMARLLREEALRQRLIEGCRASSSELGMEQMVDGFVDGVLATLGDEDVGGRLSYE